MYDSSNDYYGLLTDQQVAHKGVCLNRDDLIQMYFS